jgi:hypothetical protein
MAVVVTGGETTMLEAACEQCPDPMRADAAATPAPLEIACDESGYEGENLIGGTTDVFAHASVRIGDAAASDCVAEIHRRIQSPVTEYKAGHLLREKHRPVLEWFLGPSGPLLGNAHVHLTDKTWFVVGRMVELVAGPAGGGPHDLPPRGGMAVALYREGPAAFGAQRWEALLRAFTDLLRARNRRAPETNGESFFGLVEALRLAAPPGPMADALGQLRQGRARAEALRGELLDNPKLIPVLEILFPAIARAVAFWSDGRTPVAVVHDEHSALTTDRVAQLRELVRHRLAGVRRVDSRSDPRVQVADFLAGVARRIASDELNRRGDEALAELLRPYVDARSAWVDGRSWAALRPPPAAGLHVTAAPEESSPIAVEVEGSA